MENSTKIYIGVGAAALIAFLLFRNAAAQKPVVPPVPEKDCPAGQRRVQPKCIKAPCPSYCMPKFFDEGLEGFNYGGYGGCPEGTKPCVNNPSKCVNPEVIYKVDPCA